MTSDHVPSSNSVCVRLEPYASLIIGTRESVIHVGVIPGVRSLGRTCASLGGIEFVAEVASECEGTACWYGS